MWIELSMHRNLFFLTQELEPRPAWDSNIRGLNLQTEKHFIKIRWCWLGWIHTSSDCQTDTEMKGASWIYLFIYCICEFLPSFVQYLWVIAYTVFANMILTTLWSSLMVDAPRLSQFCEEDVPYVPNPTVFFFFFC